MTDYITRAEATQLFYVREAVDEKTNIQNINVAFRRGATDANDTYRGRPGELTYDNEQHQIRFHDGETMGGHVFVNVTDLYTRPELDGILGGIQDQVTTTIDSSIVDINTAIQEIEATINSGLVTSVSGKSGEVILRKDDIGLGSVNNTSDADKPVSTAQQAALNGKIDKGDVLDFGEL